MNATEQASVSKNADKDERILEAATKVFAEQGFDNAETQVIADLAKVGKGTVYRYYKNKEELFLAVADYGMKKLERHILDAMDSADSTLRSILRVGILYAEFFQTHPELVEILIQERAAFRGSIPDTHLVYRRKNRGVLEDLLRQGIKDGVIRDVNIRETTNTFANVLYGTVVCGCIEGSAKRLKRVAGHAVELFLRGIVTDASLLEGE